MSDHLLEPFQVTLKLEFELDLPLPGEDLDAYFEQRDRKVREQMENTAQTLIEGLNLAIEKVCRGEYTRTDDNRILVTHSQHKKLE